MNAPEAQPCPTLDPAIDTAINPPVDAIAAALVDPGWIALPGALTPERVRALLSEIDAILAARALRPARTGRGVREDVRTEVRGDLIAWMDAELLGASPELAAWHAQMKTLGEALRDALRLPVAHFDGHVTRYPEGAFYLPHVDAPLGSSRRLISVVLYLNEDWEPADDGVLRLWPQASTLAPALDAPTIEIAPCAGTMTLFRSAGLWHEVRPTRRPRTSITGWFMSRA